jgi:hypothetical protein
MGIVGLCRYISGMLVLLFGVSFLITYAPGRQDFGAMLTTTCGAAALVAAALSILLGRFPQSHWVHQSKPLWAAFAVLAGTVTFVVILVG